MLKCQDDLHREFKDFKGSITRQLIALQVLSIIAPPVTFDSFRNQPLFQICMEMMQSLHTSSCKRES
jgi:hypothetical protein